MAFTVRVLAFLAVAALALSTFCSIAPGGGAAASEEPDFECGACQAGVTISRQAMTDHDPVLIFGDGDFTTANGVTAGDGTEGSPFIIEGWNIDASGSFHGIILMNTTSHFIIRNCDSHSGMFSSKKTDGIFLSNVTNGLVTGNSVHMNTDGISMEKSRWVAVESNEVRSCIGSGITFSKCSNITMTDNSVQTNLLGVSMFDCVRIIVFRNTIQQNGDRGIYMRASSRCVIYYNEISANEGGLEIQYKANYNLIHHNNFKDNNVSNGKKQGFDYVGTNFWNTSGTPHGYGNYWSEWTTPDANSDGIVDSPYNLSGGMGARDHFPLSNALPVPQPVSSADVIVLAVFLVAVAGMVSGRRRKSEASRMVKTMPAPEPANRKP